MITRWQQIEQIFNEALDVPPETRDTFLDEACRLDPELKKEVESLIKASERSSGFMYGAIQSAADAIITEKTAPAEGERLGAYRIVREIGRGGMGAVYLAYRDDDQYEKKVAIKLVKRGMDTDAVLARFRAERQILARLDHPNIARLLDGGTTKDGRPYLVMEYIEGVPISSYCSTQSLSADHRCELFLKVCSAVQFAHQNLVVHRDLKPGNILVTADGTPKLLDFGIAKLLSTSSTHQTVGLQQVLTPDYASPEQVRGEPITTATDVYLLGGVLYELLTGRCPHEVSGTSLKEIEAAICLKEVERPSSKVDGKARKALTGDLDCIILTALRKEPQRRYNSVEQFADDIKRYLTGMPIAARPDTIGYRAVKFVRRNAMFVAAGTALALTIVAGSIATEYQARRAERERQQAVAAQSRAERNEKRAEQETSRAESARLMAEEQRKRAETEAIETKRQRTVADQQRQIAEKRFDQVHQLANTFLYDFDNAIRDLPGSMKPRTMLVQTALKYLDSLSQEATNNRTLQRELAVSYEKIGDVQGNPYGPNVGDVRGALASYAKALSLRKQLFDDSAAANRDLMLCQLKIADVLSVSGRSDEAMKLQSEVIDRGKHELKDHGNDPELLKALARAYARNGDLLDNSRRNLEAAARYSGAADVYAQLVVTNPKNDEARSELGVSKRKLAGMLLRMHQMDKALATAVEAAEIHRALTNEYKNNQTYRRELMADWIKVGDTYVFNRASRQSPADATRFYENARLIAFKAYNADPTNQQAAKDLALCSSRMGDLLMQLHFPSQAISHFETAVRAETELLDRDPSQSNMDVRSDRAYNLVRWARALHESGDSSGSQVRFREAIDETEKLCKLDPDQMVNFATLYQVYHDLGLMQRSDKKYSAAADSFLRAANAADVILRHDSSEPSALHKKAEAYYYLSNVSTSMARNASEWRIAKERWTATRDMWRKLATLDQLDTGDQAIDQEATDQIAACDRHLK